MMSGEAWLYLLAVLLNAVNLFLQVFFTIMYSDLEWYVYSRPEAVHIVLPADEGFRATVTTLILSTSATDSTPTSYPKLLYMAF